MLPPEPPPPAYAAANVPSAPSASITPALPIVRVPIQWMMIAPPPAAPLARPELPPPLPSVSDNKTVETQSFYIAGEGNLEDEYAWVLASREDIGMVSEIYGALYEITATATRLDSGRTTAKIVADVIKEPGIIHLLSWQISD